MDLRQAKEGLEVTWGCAQEAPDSPCPPPLLWGTSAHAEQRCPSSCLHLLSTYLHAEPSSGAQTLNNFPKAVQSQSYSHTLD